MIILHQIILEIKWYMTTGWQYFIRLFLLYMLTIIGQQKNFFNRSMKFATSLYSLYAIQINLFTFEHSRNYNYNVHILYYIWCPFFISYLLIYFLSFFYQIIFKIFLYFLHFLLYMYIILNVKWTYFDIFVYSFKKKFTYKWSLFCLSIFQQTFQSSSSLSYLTKHRRPFNFPVSYIPLSRASTWCLISFLRITTIYPHPWWSLGLEC